MTQSKIRVRFAPSPTGFLHVGGARTALFNWLWARKNHGTFILRIEDTDFARSTRESVDQILDALKWLGFNWDEGPFYQSERMTIYYEHLDKLREGGFIYPAFESKEELEEARQKAVAEVGGWKYDRASLNLSEEEVQRRLQAGDPFVWRFRVPDEGYTEVPETLMTGAASCRFDHSNIEDFAITRPGTMSKPGAPLYNFTCAVDDATMGITHVIRGTDHLSNSAKQVLLLNAFDYEVPTYTHLPLIMKNNKKMSKRDADADPRFPVSVSARRDLGYLREATVNFLALLGWTFSDEREIFTVEELIEDFNLDALTKSNANFDEDKYLFLNGWYARNKPLDELLEELKPFLAALPIDEMEPERLREIVGLVRERCTLLSDFADAIEYFFRAPESYEEKGAKKFFRKEGAAEQMRETLAALEGVESFDKGQLEEALREYCERKELGLGKVAQPVRLALTGRTASPGLFDVMVLLGREEALVRLRRAAEWIEKEAVRL